MNNVSGPINYYKLTKKNKIIYIFFDIHYDINVETECSENNAIRIDNFLSQFFEKNNKIMVDFFLETSTRPNNEFNENRGFIYLNKIRNVFRNLYRKNKKYDYLRLQYIDIRQYTELWNIWDLFEVYLNKINDNFYNLYNVLEKLKQLSSIDLLNIKNLIDNIKNNKISPTNILEKALHKIIHKYNNDDVKKKINNFFNENIYDKLTFLINAIDKFYTKYKNYPIEVEQKYFNNELKYEITTLDKNIKLCNIKSKYDEKIYNEIKLNITNFYYLYTDIFSNLMDCYALRRLLDKNYVDNSIIYCGAFHSVVYVWFLVKYFDYDIIDINKINNINKNDLIKNIKASSNFNDVYKDIMEIDAIQCVKIENLFGI